jgi:hypothetical protein
VDHPDPGVTEYRRGVGTVTCGDSREELSVQLVQRDSEPAYVSVAGACLSSVEADLLSRVVHGAVLLITTDILGGMPVRE